jgi:phenylpyruvate tautomerase PptA (4-oxalocrotonate tautomerase family)
MPLLEITTNTIIENAQAFAERASRLTAEMLAKPESYVMVKILPEQNLIFAGSIEPAAHVQLKSLDLPENRSADFSAEICAFISAELNISSARIYIEFSSPQRHMWGWDRHTF